MTVTLYLKTDGFVLQQRRASKYAKWHSHTAANKRAYLDKEKARLEALNDGRQWRVMPFRIIE